MAKAKSIVVEDFLGMDTGTERSSLRNGRAQIDKNSDRSLKGAWKPRSGLADTGIADGTSEVASVGQGQAVVGNKLIVADVAGKVYGHDVPDPVWD